MSRRLLLSYLLRATHPGGEVPDADLLRRFAAGRDEAAFELLVRRHADAVWRVCRGVARQDADAEDAFQVTFLALATKPGAVRTGCVAGWLHRVAVHAALKARARADRLGQPLPADVPAPAADDRVDAAAVHEELARLPDRYRLPVVLCDLEGHTHAEAAARLGWPVGTVSGRLSRARSQLRSRLERRGVVGAVVLASAGSAPATLIRTTAAVGTGHPPSAAVASLTAGVLSAMSTTPLKWAATAAALTLALAGGGTLLAVGTGDDPKPAAKAPDPPPKVATKPAPPDIRGTWVETMTTQVTRLGKELPPQKWEQKTIITDDRIIVLGPGGFVVNVREYKLVPGGPPDRIDATDPRRGETEGVYRLTGDRLLIQFDRPGKRPTELSDKPDGWGLRRAGGEPAVLPVDQAPNSDGWFWLLSPENPPSSKATTEGLVYQYARDADGAAVVTVATGTALDGRPRPEYRAVLFDDKKTRYVPESTTATGYGSQRDGAYVMLLQWRMDPKVLPADKVKLIGFEQAVKPTAAK